jgi:D-amino peptidase
MKLRALPCLVVFAGSAGCVGDAPQTEEGPSTEARALSDPAPNTDGTVRVLVYHDMEGLSGQSDPNTFRFSHPDQYAEGRRLLTDDVNAVVAGLFLGGAGEVHIVDGHGSGNPNPDLLLDRLHPKATLVSRDEAFDAYVDLVRPGEYDAIALVGMHAKTGSGGFASHTFTLGMDIVMNGMSLTETELVGYSWGRVGVPVIFASGDDRLGADLEEPMPWVEFVTVKTATSASTAEPRPVGEVRAELTRYASRAVSTLQSARVIRLTEPVTAALRVVPPADLSMMESVPGIDYADQTVRFEARDFGTAYQGVLGLIGVATGGYSAILGEVARQEVGTAFGRTFSDALFDRWLDVESGRWFPPETASPPSRTHHGFR